MKQRTPLLLGQESSSLPLRTQFTTLFNPPSTQPALTLYADTLTNPKKKYLPHTGQWLMEFEIPMDTDQIWQYVLQGPGVQSNFDQAILYVGDASRFNNQSHALSRVQKNKATNLSQGGVLVQFLDKPIFVRDDYYFKVTVQVYLKTGCIQCPRSIELKPIYGVIDTLSKRYFGKVVDQEYRSIDGRVHIFKYNSYTKKVEIISNYLTNYNTQLLSNYPTSTFILQTFREGQDANILH